MFNEQLRSWYLDTRAWPKQRTLEIFLEWFDVRVSEIVFDLGQGILDYDD